MIRRMLLTVCALVGAASLASCATFSNNASAARVGDVELPRGTLERYVEDALVATQPDNVPDELAGDAYRSIIGDWVIDELIRQKLAVEGIAITDEDRVAAEKQASESFAGLEVSDFVRQYQVDSLATRSAFTRTQDQGALGEFAAAASIVIDPRYGYWDSESGTVAALQP